MDKNKIINKTAKYIKAKMSGESTGHDWWHVYRVWQISKKIAKSEKADLFIVEMGALLHDIADYKFHKGDDKKGGQEAEKLLAKLAVDKDNIEKIIHIIDNISFKGAGVKEKMKSLEGKIVQDADRLDAIGAIGVARAVATGQKFERPIYDPSIKPKTHKTFKSYKNKNGTTINHFYEKLLLLKNRMNTKTGKKLAESRHRFMETFLKEFFQEWDGKK